MTPRQTRRITGEIASRNRRTASGFCPSASRASSSREAGSAFGAASAPPFARTIDQQWSAARAGVNEVAVAAAAVSLCFHAAPPPIDPKWRSAPPWERGEGLASVRQRAAIHVHVIAETPIGLRGPLHQHEGPTFVAWSSVENTGPNGQYTVFRPTTLGAPLLRRGGLRPLRRALGQPSTKGMAVMQLVARSFGSTPARTVVALVLSCGAALGG